jgi:predicted nucleotidyltransferase
VRESDLKIVKKFKELVSKKVKIIDMRVFGSRAREDNIEESDLDVFVIVEKLDRETEKYISDCAWEAGFHDDVVVVPVVVSKDTMEHGNIRESSFIKNIYKEGIAA